MKYTLFILLCFPCFFMNAQENQRFIFQNSSLYNSLCIEDRVMLGNYIKNDNAFLRKSTHYGKESFTWLRAGCDFINTHYPFCWDVLGDNAYILTGGDDFGASFGIFKVPINLKDSLTYIQQKEAFHDSLKQVHKTEKEYKEYIYNVYLKKLSQKRNNRFVTQLSELPRVLQGIYKDYPLKLGSISFDMVVIDSLNIEFYIRDMKQITQWHYKYPLHI